jgi:ABC-2 type transport system permease protein
MQAYLAILSARFRTLLQYRAAAAAGFGTQLFWGLIRMMIFTAFYQSSTATPPMKLEDVISYVWLGQALLAVLPFRWDNDVAGMIRHGNIGYELAKPVDLYGLWFCRAIALRTAPTLLRCVPMVIVAGLFLGLKAPASVESGLLFALSMTSAVLLSAALTVLMSISLMWTLSADGVANLVPTVAWTLSGIVVPLPLFPDWAQVLLNAQPFRGLFDVPFRIYVGHIPPPAALPQIGLQLAWVVALVLLGRWLLARGLKRVVVQGG